MNLRIAKQPGNVGSPSMSRLRTIRGYLLGLSGIAGLCTLAGGCGYSDHDEYFRIRGIVIEPTRGDGSMIASLDRPGQNGNARAAMATGRARGWATDQPISPE